MESDTFDPIAYARSLGEAVAAFYGALPQEISIGIRAEMAGRVLEHLISPDYADECECCDCSDDLA